MNELKQVFMRCGYDEIVYINNKGKAFELAEVVGLDHSGSYDRIIATPGHLVVEDGVVTFEYDFPSAPIWFQGSSDFCDVCGSGRYRERALQACKEYLDEKSETQSKRELFKPEAFYTGGGIWLSAMYVDDTHYVVVDNEDRFDIDDSERCLTMYDATKDDDPADVGEFQCMEFVWSKNLSDLSNRERRWYKMLLAELKKEAR